MAIRYPIYIVKKIIFRSLVIIFFIFSNGCSGLKNNDSLESPVSPASTITTIIQPTLTLTPTEIIIQGTVTIWHSLNESEMNAFEKIIDDFSLTHPNIYFDVQYIPLENLKSYFETQTSAGVGPTILLGPAEWGPSLLDSGLIQNLNAFKIDEILSGINKAALDSAHIKNALTGIPFTLDGVVLFRNRSIIPDSAATWEQLINNALFVTEGDMIGAYLERSFLYSGAHLEGIGGKLMEPNGIPAFYSPAGTEWLNLLKEFEQAGPTDYHTDQDLDLFKQGRVGIIIDGTWNLEDLADSIGIENLIVDTWPQYSEGKLSGFLFPQMIYLVSNADENRKLASWEFIRYLVSKEAQTTFAEAGVLPAASEITLTDPITGTLVMKTISALQGGTSYPIIPEMESYSVPMDLALRSFFSGASDPNTSLQLAHDEIIKLFETPVVTPAVTP